MIVCNSNKDKIKRTTYLMSALFMRQLLIQARKGLNESSIFFLNYITQVISWCIIWLLLQVIRLMSEIFFECLLVVLNYPFVELTFSFTLFFEDRVLLQ